MRARIKLVSPEVNILNSVSREIIEIARRHNAEVSGPIPLPTKVMKVTTRKSPDGGGTATFDRFEMRIHKRLIEIAESERALRHVMRVNIPESVNIEVELLS